MTQEEKVLRHLQRFGSITAMEAIEEYGILRLGARICDLRAQGILIETEQISAKNRFGEKTHYAKYKLIQ